MAGLQKKMPKSSKAAGSSASSDKEKKIFNPKFPFADNATKGMREVSNKKNKKKAKSKRK